MNLNPFRPPGTIQASITLNCSIRRPLPFSPEFLQRMVNRLIVGGHRHGENGARQDYLKRLRGAARRYEETGNVEFLVDVANYALLEAHYPLHQNAHFKCTDSCGKTELR